MKYRAILADPPWTYDDKAAAGDRGAEFQYPCLTLPELKALQVSAIAAEDCALFLWVTWPQIAQGLELMSAWGFRYSTCAFTWVKTGRSGPVEDAVKALLANELPEVPERARRILEKLRDHALLRPAYRLGMWQSTRANTEVCLLGLQGRLRRVSGGVRQVVETCDDILLEDGGELIPADPRRHSEKPDEVPTRIVQLLGDVPRLEMFARCRREGWDAWGDHTGIGGDVSIPVQQSLFGGEAA